MEKEITVKIKAFSCEKKAVNHRLLINEDGSVLVYDETAGFFTSCHIVDVKKLKV